MKAEAEPTAAGRGPAPAGASAAEWQTLFSLEKRDADRAVIVKALQRWCAETGARRAALFAVADGGLQPVAEVGEAAPEAAGAPPADLARLDLPSAALFHDAPGTLDPEEPGLLLIAAGARICRLKQQILEHRFQANLRGVELQALYEVGLAIAATLDIGRLSDEILLRAVSLLDARRAALYLAETGYYHLLGQFGGDNARPGIAAGEVDVAGLLADDAPPPKDLLPGVRHLLAVPVEIDGSPRGLLVVGDKESRTGIGPFGAKDRRMALLFANQAALALENAKLHKLALEKERLEREMELASEIQKQILPKSTPKLAGFELAGWYRPARHVGGDYYSFLTLSSDRVALVVADVTGKGMPAALLVSTVHSAARLLLDRVGPGPEFMALLNSHICESSKSNKFITFLFAWLDLEAKKISWINAGHNPGLLIRREGKVVTLPSSGVPLGLIPVASYRAATLDLEPGDLVCLYSDGITEAEAPDDEQYGQERLENLLREKGDRPLDEILHTIDHKMVEFAASRPQGDDQTVVLLRRTR